jgi:hypothetical protein
MELTLDPDKFEELQKIFIKAVIETTMIKLVESGLKDRQLEEVTASIAFSISSLIDDTTGIESGGIDVKPYLTFRTGDDELTHCGENAYTYEFVRGALKDLFDV